MKNIKRNYVKLHDNVLKIMQDREEERKERQDMMQLIIDLRDEIKLIVIISFNRTLLIMLNLVNHCP